MFVLSGLLGVSVGLGGYLFPAICHAERNLPDHDSQTVPVLVEARDA